MERIYIASLSGKILSDSTAETVERLSAIFSDKKPAEIEQLIANKAVIKKSIGLDLANKIKSKIEQAGAECIISVEEIPQIIEQHQKSLPETIKPIEQTLTTSHKSEGAFFLSAALILILTLMLVSSGYDPRYGLLYSINENMTVYDGYPLGCKEEKYLYRQQSEPRPEPRPGAGIDYSSLNNMVRTGGCAESFKLVIMTKYLLLALLVLLAYGIGRYLNHFSSIKSYWETVRRKFE